MKKLIFISLFILNTLFAQISINAGMGINISNFSSLEDYINYNFSNSAEEMKSLESTFSFFGEIDFTLTPKYQIGIEYHHTLFSYNSAMGLYKYDFNLNIYQPTILIYYMLKDEKNYSFKVGGGLGYRYADIEEKNNFIKNYSANGFGAVVKIVGNTAIDDNLFVYLSGELRYDNLSEPEDENGNKIYNFISEENVNVNNISAGIKLGLTYNF